MQKSSLITFCFCTSTYTVGIFQHRPRVISQNKGRIHNWRHWKKQWLRQIIIDRFTVSSPCAVKMGSVYSYAGLEYEWTIGASFVHSYARFVSAIFDNKNRKLKFLCSLITKMLNISNNLGKMSRYSSVNNLIETMKHCSR